MVMTYFDQFEQQQRQDKAWYLAAKLGLINICWNCRKPIRRMKYSEGEMWVHTEHPHNDDRPCWSNMEDGYAVPMDEADLADWHEDIMKYEDEDEEG
jgi:hypothetical protein